MSVRSGLRGRLTADERTRLERLVAEIGPRLLAYVRRTYGNKLDAEEIVAETYCRAAGNMKALRASDRQDLYVLTIARNLCRDRFRRRRPEPISDDRREHRPSTDGQPHEAVAQEERAEALRTAVTALPESLREVVVLRLSTGLKFEQIAELLHIPLGTALSRMHAAVQHLRDVLGSGHGP